jgi:ABC-type multidrug transport system fused ATPase/permease subunit
MKDDEIIKTLLDIEGDNIKQEREVFKHIAIVSAAIVGVFVFNGDFVITGWIKYGLIGLILVIILSVALLFIIIRVERSRARQALKSMQEIKQVRSDFVKNILKTIFNKKVFSLVQECWKEKDLMKLFYGATPTGLAIYNQITESDKKIEEAKEKSRRKTQDRLFSVFSYGSIIIFLASLIMILFEIIY